MAVQSARNGQIVLVPEFDSHQFPDFYAYNFGGVRLPPPSNTVLPREHWNFGITDRLFAHVRDSIGSNRRSFGLFGNSAGAQYVLRYLALTEAPAADAAVLRTVGSICFPTSPPNIQSAWVASISTADICEGTLGVAL